MSEHEYKPQWNASNHDARSWHKLDNETIECDLTPRHCKIREGRAGFCGVRKNVGGKLVTLNYGRATHLTQEVVETEAVFHYAPGSPILSLGNIGCMMNCDYCQNWKTSQARLLDPKDVHKYDPQDIIDICLERNIPIISWTYNDPVVWQEFVLDTSRLAKQNGIKVLYKSAFYITEEAAADLCQYVDIFSISLKSMDPVFYKKISKGELQPALDATKYVFEQRKHVEVSNLMVTDANDSVEDARKMGEWVMKNLSENVPLHFVRFHPDYKFTHVGRTPIDRLLKARKVCMDLGIKYCYLGNAYDVDAVHSYCHSCGTRLVERYGLHAEIIGLTDAGMCASCGEKFEYVSLDYKINNADEIVVNLSKEKSLGRIQERTFEWFGDINSIHVEIENRNGSKGFVSCLPFAEEPIESRVKNYEINPNTPFRFALSKSSPEEKGVSITGSEHLNIKIYEVYDRAHFPTIDIDTGGHLDDATPLPKYTRDSRKT